MKEVIKAFNGKTVRLVIINHEPWFVAKDVFKCLGIPWTGNQALSIIPDSWKGVREFLTPRNGGTQYLVIISEPALYKIVFRSRKPEADRFTNWVASEVLPSLRKTGKYEIPSSLRLESKEARKALTKEWKEHGAEKRHHYINLTYQEYEALGYENPRETKKANMSEDETARLMVFESIERLKLTRHPEIQGYHLLKDSLIETGTKILPVVERMIVETKVTAPNKSNLISEAAS